MVFLITLAGAALQAAAVPGEGTASPPPSLLLVTVDTWRWDYIGASGSGKVETPTLDRLAGEGIFDPEAVTPVPLTTPAHASLMTGVGPMEHGVWDCTIYRLGPGLPTLAESFRGAGFRTAAFVSSETLKARYGLGRGFEVYDDSGASRRAPGDWMAPSRDGQAVTDAALTHLKRLSGGERAFLWVHYFDLHLPYRARGALDKKYPRDPYAAQAAFVDGQIGRLTSALRGDKGRAWRVVVVGDHGEGMGEKGEETHGIGLYRGTLHVPLILWPKPDVSVALPKPWGLVDLAPTLREWFRFPAVPKSDGTSLFQSERRGAALFSVSVEPTLLFGVEPSMGVRQGKLLYLKGGREELFDLTEDIAQTRDLSREVGLGAELKRLATLCNGTWRPGWLFAALPPSLAPSSEELQNLQSLGYISGAAPSLKRVRPFDVREVMKDRSAWDRAREDAFRTGKNDGLLALYARLVVKYPTSLCLRNWYGPLLARVGRTREAILQLEEAVRLFPGDSVALSNLGALYMLDGRHRAAENFLKSALERDGSNRMAHKQLGILYADHLNLPEKAVPHYRKYLQLGGDSDSQSIKTYVQNYERAVKGGNP